MNSLQASKLRWWSVYSSSFGAEYARDLEWSHKPVLMTEVGRTWGLYLESCLRKYIDINFVLLWGTHYEVWPNILNAHCIQIINRVLSFFFLPTQNSLRVTLVTAAQSNIDLQTVEASVRKVETVTGSITLRSIIYFIFLADVTDYFFTFFDLHSFIIFLKGNQLGAYCFLVYLFDLLYMFRATMCPSGELTVSIRHW